MKILFLTQTYPRFDEDTAGPFIRDLARGLVAGGDEVTVLLPHASDVPPTWNEDGVEALSFRYAPEVFEVLGYGRSLSSDEVIRWRAGAVAPLYFRAARTAVKRLVRQRSFDLVQGHWVVPNGLVVATDLGRPVAIGLHGSDVFLAERPAMRVLVRRALSRTSLLTGCSPELVDRVCALGFDRQRARVIPYGVDTEQFTPGESRRNGWRQRLAIPDRATVVLAIGRMVTKKGFHILLDCLPELLERFPDAYFVFGGDGDRLEEFKRRASHWSDRVLFPGVILRDTLPDLYRCADLFVLPAVHDPKGNVDGLPNVILEAMASGLPVVATAISGIPLAVSHGEHGLLVDEQNSRSLCAALSKVLGEPSLRSMMGLAARRKAETELTWTAVAARYRMAYEEALTSLPGQT